VNLVSLTRGTIQEGTPFGIQAVTLQVEGTYFDLEDFFYRLENYVSFHSDSFNANGRLLQIVSVQVSSGSTATTSGSPTLQASISMNAYLQPAQATGTTSTGGAQ
jgi:hypothetical protein